MTLYCPYCNHGNEDPEIESLEEDEIDYTVCEECERNFSYHYSISSDFYGDEMENDLDRSKRHINYLKKRLKTDKSEANDYDIAYTQTLIGTAARELEDIKYKIEENKKKVEIKIDDLPY